MAAIDFPNSPTNGQKFTSAGITWTYQAGIGWTIDSAVVEAGSGFTFVTDTQPLPVNIGDTWFDISTAATGGTSWVAIEEAPGGELIWVQFAPGQQALPPMYVYRTFSYGAFSLTGSAVTSIPFADTANPPDGYGGIGNPSAGVMVLPKGIFMITMTMRFATTFGTPGIVANLATSPGNSPVAAVPGNSAWGVTQHTWMLDQRTDVSPNSYLIQVYNYMSTIACNGVGIVAAKISDRI